MAGGDSTKERALSSRSSGWAQGWGERARVGVLDARERREGVHSGRNTGIHCTREWVGRGGGTEHDYGGMWLQPAWEMRWRDYASRCRTEVRGGGTEQTTLFASPVHSRPGCQEVFTPQWSMQLWGRKHNEGKLLLFLSVRLFEKSKVSFKWIKHPDLCRVVVVVVFFSFF